MKRVKPLKFDVFSNDGETFVRIHMDTSLIELGVKTFSLSRPGIPSPCLGEQGWQASENRFLLQLDPIVREAFFIPQGIYALLDSSTNYQVVFFDSHAVPVAEGVMRVKGGIGRRKSSVIPHAAHATLSASEFVTSQTELDVIAASLPAHTEPRDAPDFPVWSASATPPTLSESSSPEHDERVATTDVRRELPALPERRAAPAKCKSPGCAASIVSTMKICPFCGSAQ